MRVMRYPQSHLLLVAKLVCRRNAHCSFYFFLSSHAWKSDDSPLRLVLPYFYCFQYRSV
ncbi:unnamed protein product [Periconia digitata]|uniref:Uncharacterized protein n=1 Tax=Periconia digitata TaxID=1303443 RepID=A0A9W4UID5_9PLEO|nr:unnamed protein product [Periconia digitata]